MNLWSLVSILLFVWGLRGISQKNAFILLIFAYIYTLDTILTYLFTLYFAGAWFKENDAMGAANGKNVEGSPIVVGTSSPTTERPASTASHDVEHAGVSTIPLDLEGQDNSDNSGQNADHDAGSSLPIETGANVISSYLADNATSVAGAALAAAAAALDKRSANGSNLANSTSDNAVNKSATLAQETSVTMVITVALMLVRLYCNLIIIAYARMLVRRQNLRANTASAQQHSPFSAKLQHYALSVAERFWTGNPFTSKTMMTQMRDEDEATARLAVKFEE